MRLKTRLERLKEKTRIEETKEPIFVDNTTEKNRFIFTMGKRDYNLDRSDFNNFIGQNPKNLFIIEGEVKE